MGKAEEQRHELENHVVGNLTMQLNPQILEVLNALGADENELASLTEYFAAQLVAAEASVAQIDANIESLQRQREEEAARTERLRAGIAKFVVAE